MYGHHGFTFKAFLSTHLRGVISGKVSTVCAADLLIWMLIRTECVNLILQSFYFEPFLCNQAAGILVKKF